MTSTLMSLLWLSIIVFITHEKPIKYQEITIPKELASKITRNPHILSQASTDYGHIIHQKPFGVLEPTSTSDISNLIKHSNSLPQPFTIFARGQGHSLLGQAMTNNGIVVDMTQLNGFKNGSRIVGSKCDGNGKSYSSCYVDVGGEQMWIDVLNEALKRGFTPLSWTDYLYLSVGGTLSNAGISGQTFRFGPQISNVLELDVITGLN